MLHLHRRVVVLDRDVVLLPESDEEVRYPLKCRIRVVAVLPHSAGQRPQAHVDGSPIGRQSRLQLQMSIIGLFLRYVLVRVAALGS
jgi:hypothetical protein